MANPHLIVVIPFCMKDAMLALRNLEWQAELGDKMTECVLTYDDGTSDSWISQITTAAKKSYGIVRAFRYSNPPAGYWPPNWAFKKSAEHMMQTSEPHPWLWLEPDAIPLCPNWLKKMEDAYYETSKPFFAPQIPDLGHFNGTGIYPWNTPNLIKHGINDPHTAWDVSSKSEMLDAGVTDCSHLLQHAWTVHEGRPHPYWGGQPPTFLSKEDLRMILPTAVIFHRCKDSTLIDRLRACVI